MRRNWVMKLLVVCNAVSAAGLLYSAYHMATFTYGFPESPVTRWIARFYEVFPAPGILVQIFFDLTGKPAALPATGARVPIVIVDCVFGLAAGALAYGLARYYKWARTSFGVLAGATALARLSGLAAVGAYLFSGNFRAFLSAQMAEQTDPQFRIVGLMVGVGCVWLMWKWRNEPEKEAASPSPGSAPQRHVAVYNAWEETRKRKLTKWLWGIRVSIPVIVVPTVLWAMRMRAMLAAHPNASRSPSVEAAGVATLLTWFLLLGLIWYLVSKQDERLGTGMAVGYGALHTLLYAGGIALSPAPLGMLLLLGVSSWRDLVVFALPILGCFAILACGIAASIRLGRTDGQTAGKWATGVFAALIVGAVLSQIVEESTWAKAPAMTEDQAAAQSEEYSRGHTARGMVRVIGKCVFQYAKGHPAQGFPEKLEQLGATGDGCLQRNGGPEVPGHVFAYEAWSSRGTGRRDRFKARSQEVAKVPSTFPLPDDMVDETGVFANVAGDKRGFAFSPALNLVATIGNCLKREFQATGTKGYPSNLHGILSIKGDYGTACVQPFQAKDLSVFGLWRNDFVYSGYRFTYAALKESGGEYKGFQLQARPEEYGKEALRSYYMDESGAVHATPEDRAANAGDADAGCELTQKNCPAGYMAVSRTGL